MYQGAGSASGDVAGGSSEPRHTRLIVRPATHADFVAFSSDRLRTTVYAYAGEIDGEIIGLGGLAYVNGMVVAFADLTEGARKHKVALYRIARTVMAEAKRRGHTLVYAEAQSDIHAAPRWLVHLGFTEINEETNVWLWRG